MMKHLSTLLFLVAFNAVSSVADGQSTTDPIAATFFEKQVRPVLADNCFRCHSNAATRIRADLYLDSRAGMLKGGENGPAIVPGDPDRSLIINAVRRVDPDTAMPPKSKLSESAVAALTQWVRMGAPWPGSPAIAPAAGNSAPPAPAPAHDPTAEYERLRRELWSWQKIKDPAPPSSPDQALAKNDIDRFILLKLEEKDLHPSPPADKATLIRRATFDLIGLPPTPKEIDAFVRETAPDAFEKLVDRLLASPHFGERWGRHWLDVARYGESTGMTRNLPYYYAWRYRDYVISAFNQDKPYNRFLTEQLAGDQLPATTASERDQCLTATGFLAIGPKDFNEKNLQQFVMNNVDEQIDATGRAMLATTISCARCHDHKFDPIPTREYYSLAGIFRSTQIMTGLARARPAMRPQFFDPNLLLKLTHYTPVATSAEELPATQDSQRRFKQKNAQNLTPQERAALFKPLAVEALTMGVMDVAAPADTQLLLRGDLATPGPTVSRGFLNIPSMGAPPAVDPGHSGRLQLAEWITRADNPLTSRVIVNRIWLHLFGRGIVPTPDNFGESGEPPSHPELLDYLASRFMQDGWSIKKSIRLIMLSATYQQASTFDRAKYAVDPDNRLLWRQSQRRLEAESIRDAMLAAAGDLNPSLMTGSDVMKLPPGEVRKQFRRGVEFTGDTSYRSIYLPIYRSALPEVLDAFDAADPDYVTGSREVTTVAPQALFMLNSPFAIDTANKMARRLQFEARGGIGPQIEMAYRIALGRAPSGAEQARASAFISGYIKDDYKGTGKRIDEALGAFCQALFGGAEFRYVN